MLALVQPEVAAAVLDIKLCLPARIEALDQLLQARLAPHQNNLLKHSGLFYFISDSSSSGELFKLPIFSALWASSLNAWLSILRGSADCMASSCTTSAGRLVSGCRLADTA